ncbi:hypothetical protein RQP53_05190 [Paucibacter sp. APW11]|uniref:Lipoprotein n=1 Tax=Roseateles aquae TaxID=3077235 RepID=A0ABU3P7V8_9BURK|nr:hypothetical protein [Paucibacter sp. APW11]MDT8998661.1 hypothetical protein [Paucibacter sp. APW11]
MTRIALPPWLIALPIATVVLAGCASNPLRMAKPPELAGRAAVLEVSDRSSARGLLVDESFKLGSDQVSQVKRDWDSGGGLAIGPLSTRQQREGFRYRYLGREDWDAQCEYTSQERGLQLFKSLALEDNKAHLSCACRSGSEQVQIDLDDEWKPLQGSARIGSSSYRISQIAERRTVNGMAVEQGLKSPALGYRLDDAARGQSVAAVEVLHPGRVWLAHQLPASEREPLACLMAGLMLYGPQQ